MDTSTSENSSGATNGNSSAKKRSYESMSKDELIEILIGNEILLKNQGDKLDELAKSNAMDDSLSLVYSIGKIAGQGIKEQAKKEVASLSSARKRIEVGGSALSTYTFLASTEK